MSSNIEQAVSECVHQYERMSYADREAAIERLQQFDHQDVIAALSVNASHANASVRIASQWLLAYLEPSAGISAAIEGLRDSEQLVREYAAGLLHDWPDPVAVPALIQTIMTDQADEVRAIACAALEVIRDKRALSALEWVASNDTGQDCQGTPIKTYAQAAISKIHEANAGQHSPSFG
jgi:HEAT repeat protein